MPLSNKSITESFFHRFEVFSLDRLIMYYAGIMAGEKFRRPRRARRGNFLRSYEDALACSDVFKANAFNVKNLIY